MKNTAIITNENIQQAAGPEPAHEAGMQRGHIRIQLPATAKIGEQVFKIVNLSAGGFSIQTRYKYEFSFKGEDVEIYFPFESFTFHLKAKAVAVYHNKDKALAGFLFQETARRQASLLDHIIKSYLAGLLETKKGMIAIAARDNYVPPRELAGNDNAPRKKLGRFLPLSAMGVALVLGAFVLFGNVYESAAMAKSHGGEAGVTGMPSAH